MCEHLGTRIEQEYSEESQNPFKLLYHSCSGKDEDAPQHQGSEDAPEENFMLVFPLYAEEGKEHQEDEEIVHRERLLYQVSCQKLHRLLMGGNRVEEIDADAEQQRDCYPHSSHL